MIGPGMQTLLLSTFQSLYRSNKVKGGIYGLLPEIEPAFLSCVIPAVHKAGWNISTFAMGPEDHLAEISWDRSEASNGIDREPLSHHRKWGAFLSEVQRRTGGLYGNDMRRPCSNWSDPTRPSQSLMAIPFKPNSEQLFLTRVHSFILVPASRRLKVVIWWLKTPLKSDKLIVTLLNWKPCKF